MSFFCQGRSVNGWPNQSPSPRTQFCSIQAQTMPPLLGGRFLLAGILGLGFEALGGFTVEVGKGLLRLSYRDPERGAGRRADAEFGFEIADHHLETLDVVHEGIEPRLSR